MASCAGQLLKSHCIVSKWGSCGQLGLDLLVTPAMVKPRPHGEVAQSRCLNEWTKHLPGKEIQSKNAILQKVLRKMKSAWLCSIHEFNSEKQAILQWLVPCRAQAQSDGSIDETLHLISILRFESIPIPFVHRPFFGPFSFDMFIWTFVDLVSLYIYIVKNT